MIANSHMVRKGDDRLSDGWPKSVAVGGSVMMMKKYEAMKFEQVEFQFVCLMSRNDTQETGWKLNRNPTHKPK